MVLNINPQEVERSLNVDLPVGVAPGTPQVPPNNTNTFAAFAANNPQLQEQPPQIAPQQQNLPTGAAVLNETWLEPNKLANDDPGYGFTERVQAVAYNARAPQFNLSLIHI